MQTLSLYVGQERMTYYEKSNAMCSSRKYPYPRRRALLLKKPHTPGISVLGGACHTPTPWNSVILQLGWVPSGKDFSVKNAVALYYYAKDIFFCDKMRINNNYSPKWRWLVAII